MKVEIISVSFAVSQVYVMHAQTPSPSCFLCLPNSSIILMRNIIMCTQNGVHNLAHSWLLVTLNKQSTDFQNSNGQDPEASGFNLPKSFCFLWEEKKMSCGNNGSPQPFCSMSWWWNPLVVWKAGWATRYPWPLGRSVQLCCWQWIHQDTVICWKVRCRVTLWKVLSTGAWPQPVL